MSGIRRGGGGRRRDGTEGEIIRVLQKIGCIVKQITGDGIPDLLCWHVHTGFFLVDAKSRTGTLTPSQRTTSGLLPFHIARTEDEALQVFFHHVRRYQ